MDLPEALLLVQARITKQDGVCSCFFDHSGKRAEMSIRGCSDVMSVGFTQSRAPGAKVEHRDGSVLWFVQLCMTTLASEFLSEIALCKQRESQQQNRDRAWIRLKDDWTRR